jgi:hypothetical protein
MEAEFGLDPTLCRARGRRPNGPHTDVAEPAALCALLGVDLVIGDEAAAMR